jgi:dienelactone hydrolase
MCHSFRFVAALTIVLTAAAARAQSPAPDTTTVSLKASDGTVLKATYFPAGRPGPGIMLLHQCNRDRTSWTSLATDAAQRGYHVLALDYRGYGESGGDQYEDLQQQRTVVAEKWPGDIDAAFAWLIAQPGVDRDRIGAAGASCGVNQSLLLARRHPEVKTVVLLSGGATPDARDYLRRTPGLPVFAAASRDDGNVVEGMKWILGWSRNPENKFVEFKAAGHGTEMFAVEKQLPPMILDWFDAKLRTAPTSFATPANLPPPSLVEQFWTALEEPGGVARARRLYESTRERDPAIVLFPEGEMNTFGYALLQDGKVADAIAAFELNADAYPKSANTYDSLSDAHLAAGHNDEALKYAEKAIAVLETDTQAGPEFAAAIRESAEKKIKALRKK